MALVAHWARVLEPHLPPPTSVYHATVSCVLSQKIAFQRSRELRAGLFAALGSSTFTWTGLQGLGYQRLLTLGLAAEKAQLLLQLPAELRLPDLPTYRGIGPWTVAAVKLMTRAEPDLFLSQDAFIRKRLAQLCRVPSLTEEQAQQLAQVWAGERSLLSRFLWRLRDSAVEKLLAGQTLGPEDLF